MCIHFRPILTFKCICQTAIRKAVCHCRHTLHSLNMPAGARSSSESLCAQCVPISACNPVEVLNANPRESSPQGLEAGKLVRYFPFISPFVDVQIVSIATHINRLLDLSCRVHSRLDVSTAGRKEMHAAPLHKFIPLLPPVLDRIHPFSFLLSSHILETCSRPQAQLVPCPPISVRSYFQVPATHHLIDLFLFRVSPIHLGHQDFQPYRL